MTQDVAVIGVGIHPFGRTDGLSGLQQGVVAARQALADAEVSWKEVGVAFGGSSSAGSADALSNHLGLTGLTFINVTNGCATGASALIGAVAAIRSGMTDIAMAVGFDKHPRGAFNVDPQKYGLDSWYGETGLMLTTQFFALKARRYMHQFGITEDALVRVAQRAYRNGVHNPNAWRRKEMNFQDIAQSTPINLPLRKYTLCSPSEGAVALVLCRADHARRYAGKPVILKSAVIRSRSYGSFEVFAPSLAAKTAPSPTVTASRAAFEQAGVGPKDIHVLQLQDTDSATEIIHLAENGFCADGEQEQLLRDGETDIHGRMPVNTDGGCLANGEPIGASGLRQVFEICLQLRGDAGPRQVPNNPLTGYTHVYGAPGVSGVTILQR
ncbi:MAG: thiolase family protein [Pseudomonadota bacterium]|nr:thiolase family protein [Pseudomonadota bacterium]